MACADFHVKISVSIDNVWFDAMRKQMHYSAPPEMPPQCFYCRSFLYGRFCTQCGAPRRVDK